MLQPCLIGANSGQWIRALIPRRDAVTLSGPANVAIRELRPTQMTVGYREVAEKRRRWREARNVSERSALERRAVPVALGPGGIRYVLDRHHWLCALAAEGVSDVPVVVAADLRHSDRATFWSDLGRRGWCRPYDAQGRGQAYCAMPSSMTGLKDDPFRSLASALRRTGGCAKDETLFSEFAWADVLRGCMRAKDLDDDFDAALAAALTLSRSVPSSNPGGCDQGVAHRRRSSDAPC